MKKGRSGRILVVVESIDVDDSSGSKANVALIQNLYKIGYELKVMHYSRRNIYLPGIDCISIKENRRSALFILSRIERYLRKHLKIKLNKPLENIFGFSFTLFNDRNSIISGINSLTGFSPDLIITLSKGGSFRPHHALLKIPELHDKWMAYIHDPYPMYFYPPPYAWKEPGHEHKTKFMKEMFEKAAHLAFPSRLLMDWMGKFIKGVDNKGIVIPHQISDSKNEKIIFPDYFDTRNFNLLHAGNLLWGRNPEGLIKAFENLLDKNPNAKKDARLILLGNRNHYTRDLQKLEKKIIELYVSDNYVSHEEVLAMQKYASVNIILEAKSEISPFLPGKFPHCIQANRPILLLGPPVSEARRLLGKDFFYWAEIDDISRISEKIGSLYNAWKLKENQELDRVDLEEYLSTSHLKETINTVFKKFIS